MTLTRLARLAALACLVVFPSVASAQAKSDEALARRIESLERRVQDLERRVMQLEGASRTEPERTRPISGDSREIANWRRLREGMSYEDVRRILGEPSRIVGGSLAIWHYARNGRVSFTMGKLTAWVEPER